ncbi:hypothetical protein GTQ34_13900 [Muricauda sp. JGD-17]|uniref:Uncharacterized protein n=1 Tax=Flagellimonas ochracea TaxID=2696472 RepID=A0A964TDP6_9FLAO|nr:hypothetical protein [Allomuricauda ochracea]NAY93013.1 hypothetical protein [Allomuricauda ochracea]
MKNIFTICSLLFWFNQFYGQDQMPNARTKLNTEELTKEKENLSTLLSFVSTGNSFTNIGNYAAISTASETLEASIFFLLPNESMFAVNVKAGSPNGIAEIFDEGELNSNVSLGLEYQFLLGKNISVTDASIQDKLNNERDAINKAYDDKIIALASRLSNPIDKKKEFGEIDAKIDAIDAYLAPYNAMRVAALNALGSNQLNLLQQIRNIKSKLEKDKLDNLEQLQYKLRELYNKEQNILLKTSNKSIVNLLAETETPKLDITLYPDLDKNLAKINRYLAPFDAMTVAEYQSKVSAKQKALVAEAHRIRNDIKETKKNNLDSLLDSLNILYKEEKATKLKALAEKEKFIKPDLIKMQYLSIGGKITNKGFTQFIDTLDLENQLTKQNYNSLGLNLSYNSIRNFDGEIRVPKTLQFLSFGVEASLTDNQSSLNQIEIVDSKLIDEESNRTQVSKQNAFVGNYEQDLASITAFLDYYNFLSPTQNSVALHINPKMLFRENEKPTASLLVGVLLPFRKKDSQKVITNLEVFYRLNDFFNTSDTDNSLLNRNVIGIQTSFPFNF